MYIVWSTNLAVGASCARDLSTHQLWRDEALEETPKQKLPRQQRWGVCSKIDILCLEAKTKICYDMVQVENDIHSFLLFA